MSENIVLAIDPGREKCGLAVVGKNEGIFFKTIADTASLRETAARLIGKYTAGVIVLGNRTFSRAASEIVAGIEANGAVVPIIFVDEHRSTEEARRRYWQENPPQGWRRLLPVSMQTPPEPVDDYVAVILAERYFGA